MGEPGLLQNRARDRDVIIPRKSTDDASRGVGYGCDPACEFSQRLSLDLLDQAADDIIEQGDVFGGETWRIVEKQRRDAAQGFRSFFCRAMLDDILQLGKQRRGNTHPITCKTL